VLAKGDENMTKITNEDVIVQAGLETIKNRARVNALAELLVEKGIITMDEYQNKINKIFLEKKEEYARELLELTEEEFYDLYEKENE
jgi:hypothetical protein